MLRVRVGVVIVQDQRVLLVRHRRRGLAYWVVPGGQVKEFEGLPKVAAREIREETGLVVRLGPLVAVFEVNDHQWRHDINFVFSAKSPTGELSIPFGGPSIETLDRAEFIDPEKLRTIMLQPPGLRSLLEQVAAGAHPALRYLGDLTAEPLENDA